MKRFINKIFPQNQKVLNFFKIAYIFLFIISIPHMFESIGVGASDTFYETIAVLACWLLFFIAIAITILCYSLKGNPFLKFFLTPILIIQIFLYFYSIKAFVYTSGLVNPMIILPILIVFILLNKKSQHFGRNIIIFLFIPFLIVAVDKLITLGFQITCPFTTPKAEYSPMYLPRQFFHEENVNGKVTLIPNVKEIDSIPDYYNYIIPNNTHTIIIYERCGWTKESITRELLEKNNIVVCKKRHIDREYYNIITSFIQTLNTPSLTIERVRAKNKNLTLATLYSKTLSKNYETFWLKNASKSNCLFMRDYSNFFGDTFRKNDFSYQNYIKLEE